MTARAVALAIAAPLLFAMPALAKPVHTIDQGTAKLTYVHHGGHKYKRHYQHPQIDARSLRRDAVRTCRRAIRQQARYMGFRDVDFDDGRRVKQIGPRGFQVTFNEVEFETRWRDVERRVSCTVRRGRVVDIHGLHAPRHRRAHHYYY